jgi:hypothetical protein
MNNLTFLGNSSFVNTNTNFIYMVFHPTLSFTSNLNFTKIYEMPRGLYYAFIATSLHWLTLSFNVVIKIAPWLEKNRY